MSGKTAARPFARTRRHRAYQGGAVPGLRASPGEELQARTPPRNPQGSGSVLCGEEGLVPVLSLNFPFPPPPSHPSGRGGGRGSQVEPSPKPTTARMADGEVGLRSLKFPPLSRFSLPDCKPGVQQMHPLARFHAAPRALLRAPWSCALGFPAASAHLPPEPCAQLASGPRRGR